MLKDLDQIICSAVTRSFGTEVRTAVGHALAGEDAVLPDILDPLVLTEQEAYLTAGNADITGGNVDVGPDVAIKLGHIGLAETHDLGVALAAGVKVGTALAAADGQAGQAVFEGLLKGKELHCIRVTEGWNLRPPL